MGRVKEMNLRKRLRGWQLVKIIIKDEEKFKESCEEFFEDEDREIELYDLEDSYFEDCVEIEHEEVEWDDDDDQEFLEYEELRDEYFPYVVK